MPRKTKVSLLYLKKVKKIPNRVFIYFAGILKAFYLLSEIKRMGSDVMIRFISVRSRFGQMVSDISHYAAEKEKGLIDSFDYLYLPLGLSVSNAFLLRNIKRSFSVIDAPTVYFLKKMLPSSRIKENYEGLIHDFDKDLNGLLNETTSFIRFSEKEIKIGESFLDRLPNNHNGIVCLSLKDRAFYEKSAVFSDYPMCNNEFSRIEDYEESIKTLIKRGYLVIRVGVGVTGKLDIEDELYFDYATSGLRSELLDLYLASKCQFILSNCSGFDMLGILYRKPVFQTNNRCFVYQVNNYPFTMFLPRRLYNRNEKRYLSFKEIFKIEKEVFKGGHYAHCVDSMGKQGVFFEDEDPVAVNSFAEECVEHLNGGLVETDKDRRLQERLWELYLRAGLEIKYNYISPGEVYLKASPAFLRENAWMLD